MLKTDEKLVVEAAKAGKTGRALAAEYGVSPSTISNVFKRAGFKPPTGRRQTCELDHAAFDTITEASAYWMGFLCADGYFISNGSGSPQIVLGLARKDRGHVEKFRAFLKSTHNVADVVNKTSLGYHDGKGGLSSYFRVRSRQLFAALERRGLACKSPERIPNDELENSVHFWRGAVDGDGTVRLHVDPRRNYRFPHIMLCGHMPLMEKFQAFLARQGLPTNITDTASGIYQIRLMGKGALKLIEMLYDNATVALDRKHATARELLREFR